MDHFPLFPLNSVLFPATPIYLNIFEQCYKEMVNDCLNAAGEFGVVLIAEGKEASGPLAKPREIGCKARINQFEILADGRITIQAIGTERFKILETSTEKSYLTGIVKPFPLRMDRNQNEARDILLLRNQIKSYVDILSATGGAKLDLTRLPDSPVELAYTAAYIIQTPLEDKQLILESESFTDIYRYLMVLFRREAALLKAMISPPMTVVPSSFSIN